MPNFFQALGQATPALTQTWQAILSENRAAKDQQMQEELQPLKVAREQAITKQTVQETAVSKATLEKTQMEINKAKADAEPFSFNDYMPKLTDSMGFTPEGAVEIQKRINVLYPGGVTTKGKSQDAIKQILTDPVIIEITKNNNAVLQNNTTSFEEKYKKSVVANGTSDPKTKELFIKWQDALSKAGKVAGLIDKITLHNIGVEKKQTILANAIKRNAYTPQQLGALESMVNNDHSTETDMSTALEKFAPAVKADTTLSRDEILALPDTDPRRKQLIKAEKELWKPTKEGGGKPEMTEKEARTKRATALKTLNSLNSGSSIDVFIQGFAAQQGIGLNQGQPIDPKVKESLKTNLEDDIAYYEKFISGGAKTRGTPPPMETMPPASQHKGRTIRDTKTNKRYRSDGTKWVEIK